MKADSEKIEALAGQVAREEMVELVDLQVAQEGPRMIVRVFLDREGGVTINDCESFSRKLGAVLEVEDPIPGAYVLEVSSPGVNRRLRRPEHFAAAVGKRIRVALGEPVNGSRNFAGTLRASDEEGIEIEGEGGPVRLAYRLMKKANVEVSQDELFGRDKGRKKR